MSLMLKRLIMHVGLEALLKSRARVLSFRDYKKAIDITINSLFISISFLVKFILHFT